MYDYGLSTLEQYGLTAESTARTRGGLLCHTEKGLVIVKEFKGTGKKTTETTGIASADPESGRQGGLLYSKSGRKSGQPRP